ncbi:MAG: hypothetical protein WDN24_17145 [Sphingomonas sp.]
MAGRAGGRAEKLSARPGRIHCGLQAPGNLSGDRGGGADIAIQPNPATAWFRDWSFSTADGAAAGRTGNGAFFRTLNLAEFARLLENALADAAEHNPGPITGFTFAVEVAD